MSFMLLGSSPVRAGLVPVSNYSFETPDQTGNGLTPPPDGWTGGVYLIDKEHTNVTTDDPLDGTDQWAMLRNVSTMSQVLSTKISADTTYTLTIDVAQRPGKLFTAVNGVDIRLGTGSTQGANLLTADTSATPIPAGSAWSTWSKTFTTGPSVPDQYLRIEMVLADATNDAQPCFDNVRLDASTSGSDTNAPIVEFFNPSDGTTGVAIEATLSVVFNEPIAIGSGTITIKNLTDGASGDLTVPVTDAAQVSAVGPVLNIAPATDFGINKEYAVQIPAGAVTDTAGNPYAGIPSTDTNTWNFRSETDYKVLILGDSISGGYYGAAVVALEGVAEVYGGGSNPSTSFLANLTAILNTGGVAPMEWDVIHFNSGLHDIAYREPDKYTDPDPAVSPELYEANLNQIVARLKTETRAKLIWASATIVPPDEPIRWEGDEVIYNAIAAPIMTANGVTINDLWTLTSTFPPNHFVGPGNVHFSSLGYDLISPQVIDAILAALEDESPPSPDPMSFALAPTALNTTSIIMTATAATDPSGPIEYYFENTTNSACRDWSTDTSWINSGLTAGVTYGYRVKARDAGGYETVFSPIARASPAADTTPPEPDPMSFASPPTALGPSSITMTAATATDVNGVEYFFDCTTPGGHDSGWQDSPTYTDTLLSASSEYTYLVRARDKSSGQIPTGWSGSASATTTASDTTPPVISSLSPTNGAAGVSVVASLVANFDESIQRGNGTIVIRALVGGASLDTIDVASDRVEVSGSTASITTTAILGFETAYYVEVDSGALKDLAGNDFTGISGSATWRFTTAAGVPVANPGFEDQDATTGFINPPLAGWIDHKDNASDGSPQIFDVNTHSNLNDDVDKPLPDGSDNAVLLQDGADLYQVLTTKVAPNTRYTLSLNAGAHQLKPFGLPEIWLGTGPTFGANRLIEDVESTVVPTFGSGWETWIANFTTGASVPDEYLRIEIRTLNTAESGQTDPQPFFDNVRLTATSLGGDTSAPAITNHSFESPDVTGVGNNAANTGWSEISGSELHSDRPSSGLNTRMAVNPDGSDQLILTTASGQGIHLELDTDIAANTIYTLIVDIGDKSDQTLGTPDLRLGVGSALGVNLLTPTSKNYGDWDNGDGTYTAANGTWSTFTYTFATGPSLAATGALRIELHQTAAGQTGFDNVRFTAKAVNPPANPKGTVLILM